MYSIILLCLLTLLSSACVAAQSDDKNSNIPMSVAKTISTLSPNLPAESSAKLANRTTTKLDFNKMLKTDLAKQPRTIIKTFAFFEFHSILPKTKEYMKYADRTEVYLVERDLNNDGISERIVYELPIKTGDGKSPTLAIFRLEKKKWKVLFVQSGDITVDKYSFGRIPTSIEFLSSGIADDFDIIKVTERIPTNELGEITKRITYYEWEKDGFDGTVGVEVEPIMEEVYSTDSYEQFGFESYMCRATDGGRIDETVPCIELKP